MTLPSQLQQPLELAYHRRVLFAVELVDVVTQERVSQGVRVVAEGLRGKPVVNAGGVFVWLEEDFGRLQKISIDPEALPYEPVELPAAEVQTPLTTVQLLPRIDYPFGAGITGLRGTLIEARVASPQRPEPVGNAEVRLRWLDEDGTWQDAPTKTRTHRKSGDFVSILRLPSDPRPAVSSLPLGPPGNPNLVVKEAVTVRLRVSRDGFSDRRSAVLKLLTGRMTNPTKSDPLTFAWNELMP